MSMPAVKGMYRMTFEKRATAEDIREAIAEIVAALLAENADADVEPLTEVHVVFFSLEMLYDHETHRGMRSLQSPRGDSVRESPRSRKRPPFCCQTLYPDDFGEVPQLLWSSDPKYIDKNVSLC
jgi:hypothetical protein